MKWVSCAAAALILGVALWLFGSPGAPSLAPASVTPDQVSRSVEPAIAEAAIAQRTEVAQVASPKSRWEDIIAKAPRRPGFPNLPLGEGPQIHYAIEHIWRRTVSPEYWQVKLDQLLGDKDVNPGRGKPSPEAIARLGEILQPFAVRLKALGAGLNEQLAEAYHRQVERGDYEVVLGRPADAEAERQDTRAAIARIESVAGRLERDHFRISVGVLDPPRGAILWATAQTAPDAFTTFAEIQAVRSRAREAIKSALAGH